MTTKVFDEAQSIRAVVKRLLKRNGLKYQDLAKELQLTEAAVKKMMIEGNFKIQRLERIANWFGYSLFELIEMAKNTSISPFSFSQQQEVELSKNPKALYIVLLLAAGFSLSQIKKVANLTDAEMKKNIFFLDRIQLISLMPGDRIKMNCRGPFKMSKNGPLQRKYLSKFINKVRNLISIESNKENGQIVFELYMSNGLLAEFRKELEQVYQKYSGLARIEKERAQPREFQAVSGVLMAQYQDSWKRVLLE